MPQRVTLSPTPAGLPGTVKQIEELFVRVRSGYTSEAERTPLMVDTWCTMTYHAKAAMEPIYASAVGNPAYHLRYTWTAWSSKGMLPEPLPDPAWAALCDSWERDGLRVLEHAWRDNMIQVLFSTTPRVSPVLLATRAKGRLDHVLRHVGQSCQFSRKVSVRSVGDNCISDVESYLANQVVNGRFADARFQRVLRRLTVKNELVNLAKPTNTHSGRYWYNLHLVLVTTARQPFTTESELSLLNDRTLAIAAKKGHQISIHSVMPDHLHLAMRGNIQDSPHKIARSFQNNLAYAFGQRAIWEDAYYVGTFGEYDMDAIRSAQGIRGAP